MNIQDYIAKHESDPIKVDIVERWENRIVAQDMTIRGRAGAEEYLSRYGKGLKAPKAIGFARCAAEKGFPELAARFWEEAFFLDTGERQTAGKVAKASDAPAAPVPALKTAFGQTPQLLVACDRYAAMAMASVPAFGVQEKIDGERVIVRVSDKGRTVTAGNKKGLVRPLPLNVVDAILSLGDDCVLDGELVGTTYYAFDMLSLDGTDMRTMQFRDRHEQLTDLFADIGLARPCEESALQLVPLITGKDEIEKFIDELESRGAEGFVIKRLDAPYTIGSTHGDQWKFQFRSIVSCIVGERNGDKDSVEIFVLRADGSRRSLGYVTIPANKPFPVRSSIAEVECLYCHPGPDGKLAQAVFKGTRTDADESDCVESKLRIKNGGES